MGTFEVVIIVLLSVLVALALAALIVYFIRAREEDPEVRERRKAVREKIRDLARRRLKIELITGEQRLDKAIADAEQRLNELQGATTIPPAGGGAGTGGTPTT